MRPTLSRIVTLFLLLSLLVACRPQALPTEAASPVSTLDEQALLQTSIARVTQAALETLAFLPTQTPTPTATQPAQSTQIATLAPSPTSDLACNKADTGVPFDITVPDGTAMYAGQQFTKTWRLVNAGSCKWTRLYKLVFYSQNPMGAIHEQLLSGEVLPGQAIDLSVTFYAPTAPGTYQSNWMLQDPDGNLFGIGLNADAPFYARIVVTKDPTPTPTITLTPTITPGP